MRKLVLLLTLVMVAALLIGCTGEAGLPLETPSGSLDYTLYYGDDNAEFLVAVPITLEEKEEALGKKLVEALKETPQIEGLIAALPIGTEVNDVSFIEEGSYWVAVVDFSDAMRHVGGGSAAELMAVYAVVNTLTQLDNVDYVRFSFDGQRQEEMWGHLDLQADYQFNEDIVKE